MATATSLKRWIVALAVSMPVGGAASDYELLSASIQTRIGEQTLIGEKSPDSFSEHDLRATWRTPLERELLPHLAVGARLLGSIGIFEGPGTTALVVSAVPLLVLGTPDGRFTLDGGLGLAALSEHRYEKQDFGGHVQAALTAGLEVPLYRRIGVGYRFMHYSDAGAYGPDTTGADLHMLGLSYRFRR